MWYLDRHCFFCFQVNPIKHNTKCSTAQFAHKLVPEVPISTAVPERGSAVCPHRVLTSAGTRSSDLLLLSCDRLLGRLCTAAISSRPTVASRASAPSMLSSEFDESRPESRVSENDGRRRDPESAEPGSEDSTLRRRRPSRFLGDRGSGFTPSAGSPRMKSRSAVMLPSNRSAGIGPVRGAASWR